MSWAGKDLVSAEAFGFNSPAFSDWTLKIKATDVKTEPEDYGLHQDTVLEDHDLVFHVSAWALGRHSEYFR